jgi:membrane protein DedA with SNARE-associated domain
MIARLLSGWIVSVISALGYPGVFFLMAGESACLPIPSEVVLPFAGYIAYRGEFDLALVTAVGTLGQVLGAVAAYYVGALGGRPLVLRYGKYVLLDKDHLDTADRWFARWGSKAIFVSRLMPIVRTFIAFPAGVARMGIKRFVIYTLVGSLPWTFALTFLGYKLGPHWEDILKFFEKMDVVVAALIVAGIAYLVIRARRSVLKRQSGSQP